MMDSESLNLVRAANADLAGFLSEVSGFFPTKGVTAIPLVEIERRLAALMAVIQEVGRSIGPVSLARSEGEPGDEIKQYRAHLENLRNFMEALEAYAEERRGQLLADTRQISDALAWCDTLKLTR
ncbi:MAG TPA: hypothetical protein VGY31_15850 [Terriglobia bacterium]|nr:hypothetical protein [Terriglobia bacterium]